MIQGTIFLLIILQLILYGLGKSVLYSNANIILRSLFVVDFPTSCLKTLALCQRWRQVICQVVHLLNEFSVTENSDTEWFHNIIVNLFLVVREYTVVLPPNSLSQLKPNILLKLDSLFQSWVGILVVVKPVTLIPSPEAFCRQPPKISEDLLVSRKILL